MGGVSTPGGDGLNVELNLVPFIDLLSSLVLFLLLSAVWVQVAAINASVDTKGGRAVASNTPTKRLEVRLGKKGYELTWPATAKGAPKSLGKKQESFDPEALKAVVDQLAKTNGISSGTVAADDTIPYGELIEALDAMKAGGIMSVALSTN